MVRFKKNKVQGSDFFTNKWKKSVQNKYDIENKLRAVSEVCDSVCMTRLRSLRADSECLLKSINRVNGDSDLLANL